jgi:hypothetical protein
MELESKKYFYLDMNLKYAKPICTCTLHFRGKVLQNRERLT